MGKYDRGPVSEAPRTSRPAVTGREYAVSTNHALATLAATRILDRGGNAIDAGIAGAIALGVLQPDIVGCAGVAPMILWLAERREVVTVSGLGRWPRAASIGWFEEHRGGDMPEGMERCVVPAAPDAWITALEEFGTMSFAEVCEGALVLAREGFAMYRLLADTIVEDEAMYARWPGSKAVMLPGGRAPRMGERFRQADLATTFERLIAAEARTGGGRLAGLAAVRGEFYEGAIARDILAFSDANGGLLDAADMREFRAAIEPPVSVDYKGHEVFACGPWCQGPMLLEFLNLVEGEDLAGMGLNSADTIHRLTELMKLGFADREAYFGDPEFVDVPLDVLLDKGYAAERKRAISDDRAFPDLPPPGDVGRALRPPSPAPRDSTHSRPPRDTTYLCVVDRDGNGFSATPSDGYSTSPVIPGLGFAVSSRGDQSWLDPDHPSALAPWKRPRLTPNPALALKDGELFMLWGTPGGDVQCQAMLETFVNVVDFAMDPQSAIESERFASASFPDSFWPHAYTPGLLKLEGGLAAHGETLEARGHRVRAFPAGFWRMGGVCAIVADRANGHLTAGADPRRECTAMAW